jgi:hypothetical protein
MMSRKAGRLSRAVGAEQTNDFTGFDVEGERIQSGEIAIAFGQVVRLEEHELIYSGGKGSVSQRKTKTEVGVIEV